ncbi:hypothetical protein AMK27_35965 [Streptomyces sp. CB02009]|uniref:hypothetical protein n=1 Tax=Streptomyces sp. CB02009 TaxID=1703938 RepID=UPI00093D8F69|nr:hypothetical protein [Streptomyces sp. CB02009]OKJ49478.1 hypothetical protein AMK27_35965 [Streptomyces sp. CB02009]
MAITVPGGKISAAVLLIVMAIGGIVMVQLVREESENVASEAYCTHLHELLKPAPADAGREYYESLQRHADVVASEAPNGLSDTAEDYKDGVTAAVRNLAQANYDTARLTTAQVETMQSDSLRTAGSALMASEAQDCPK